MSEKKGQSWGDILWPIFSYAGVFGTGLAMAWNCQRQEPAAPVTSREAPRNAITLLQETFPAFHDAKAEIVPAGKDINIGEDSYTATLYNKKQKAQMHFSDWNHNKTPETNEISNTYFELQDKDATEVNPYYAKPEFSRDSCYYDFKYGGFGIVSAQKQGGKNQFSTAELKGNAAVSLTDAWQKIANPASRPQTVKTETLKNWQLL